MQCICEEESPFVHRAQGARKRTAALSDQRIKPLMNRIVRQSGAKIRTYGTHLYGIKHIFNIQTRYNIIKRLLVEIMILSEPIIPTIQYFIERHNPQQHKTQGTTWVRRC